VIKPAGMLEYEADIFGLNASRQPDVDHPSRRTRIFSAMRWKAENIKK